VWLEVQTIWLELEMESTPSTNTDTDKKEQLVIQHVTMVMRAQCTLADFFKMQDALLWMRCDTPGKTPTTIL
jgi:hypothetical protein